MSLIKFKGPNLVTNGDFETGDATGWGKVDLNGAASTFAVLADFPYEGSWYANVQITNGGTGAWDIQLYTLVSNSIDLVEGEQYTAVFSARAAAVRTIGVAVTMNIAPYTNYGLNQTVNLTTDDQVFTYDFTATATASDGRLYFLLGGNANGIGIDVVEVARKVAFTRNPVYGGLGAPYGFRQPRDLSDGGVFYSYDKGVLEEFIELKWQSLPLADWTNLDSFIRTTAEGAKNAFTYYDQDGAAHAVRLESGQIDFREARYQRYAGSLILRKVA